MTTRNDRIETVYLPVALTPAEWADRATEAAIVDRDLREAEAAEKTRSKAAKDTLSALDARAAALSHVVREKKETRPVECEWAADFHGRVMILRRMDTGDTVRSRPMTDDERDQWAQGDLLSLAEIRAREATVRDALERQRAETRPAPAASDTPRIHGLSVGDAIVLNGIPCVVLDASDECFTWRTTDHPTDHDEGVVEWGVVEDLGGGKWDTKKFTKDLAPKVKRGKATAAKQVGGNAA